MSFRGLVDQSLKAKRLKKEGKLTSRWLNAPNMAGAADTCPTSALRVNRTKVVAGSIPLARSVAFHWCRAWCAFICWPADMGASALLPCLPTGRWEMRSSASGDRLRGMNANLLMRVDVDTADGAGCNKHKTYKHHPILGSPLAPPMPKYMLTVMCVIEIRVCRPELAVS